MIGFIVRNPKEVNRAEEITQGKPVLFLATNTDTYLHCLKKSKEAVLLDEEPLASRHRKINKWAFESMFYLLNKYRNDEKKSLYLDSFFYDLRSCLLFSLKYMLVLEKMVRDKKIGELRLFRRQGSLLEMALERAFHENSSPVKLKIEKEVKIPAPCKKRPLRKVARSLLTVTTNWIAFFLMKRWKSGQKKLVLVSGSPRHLGDTLCGLKTAGCEILHVETVFNFEQFRFAAKNGFAYRVIPAGSGLVNPFKSDPLFDQSGEISFEGRDFADFFNAIFMSFEKIGLLNFSFDALKLHGLLSKSGVGAVLLDEEFAQRRQIAVQAHRLDLPTFVISHGVPAGAFLDPDEWSQQTCDLHNSADIFVNSEFEKIAYTQIFYSPSRIHPIGVSRYDLLKERLSKTDTTARLSSEKKKILYCSCGFIPYDFEFLSVVSSHLGLAANISREAEEAHLKAVFAAASQIPGTIVQIKSKYGDNTPLKDFVKKNAGQTCIEILSSDADIFELEKGADVIVTAPSSIICEALMHRKPVIVFNRSYALITDIYQKRGVAIVVSNPDEFSSALTRCLTDSKFVAEIAAAQLTHAEYFAGKYDGGSVLRITERILKSLGFAENLIGGV